MVNGQRIKWIIGMLSVMTILASCKDDESAVEDLLQEENAVELAIDMSSSTLTEWTDLYLTLERYSSGRPNASARGIAYIYLAAYEVMIPAMEGYQSLEVVFSNFRIDNDLVAEVGLECALNEALASVTDHFLLNLDSDLMLEIESLRSELQATLTEELTDSETEQALAWGRHVAEQVIYYSQSDEDAEEQILDPQPLTYEPPAGEGYWTYSAEEERALYPYWSSVRTFVAGIKETSTLDPMVYNESPDSEYFEQMMEVYEANNNAKNGDTEQLWIAEFWSNDVEGLMISPPARQVSIARQLVEEFDLNLEESVVLMLKLGFSLNDAAVSTWKYKYEHMVMRPNVFVHEFIDPDFQTNLYRLIYWPNPTFPGYPSGHSAFASAAAGIFIDSFGDNVTFTDRTHEGREEFLGDPRTWSTLSEMAAENAYSRIPLGVHIRMDCDEGLRLGYEIANMVNDFSFKK